MLRVSGRMPFISYSFLYENWKGKLKTTKISTFIFFIHIFFGRYEYLPKKNEWKIRIIYGVNTKNELYIYIFYKRILHGGRAEILKFCILKMYTICDNLYLSSNFDMVDIVFLWFDWSFIPENITCLFSMFPRLKGDKRAQSFK